MRCRARHSTPASWVRFWPGWGLLFSLGFGGAICIKICTGGVLIAWLMHGGLPIPLHGYVLLWLVAFVLLVLSGAEFWIELKQNRDSVGGRDSIVL